MRTAGPSPRFDSASLSWPPARSTAVPAPTICGVQRWFVGRWMISMPGIRDADVAEQPGIGAVEAVDRLGRVADEVEVVAPADELLEQPVLQRVEVLGLVDEHVAVAEPHGVGPLRVDRQLRGRQHEQVVEVDDAAPPLERLVGGERGGDAVRRGGTPATGRPRRGDVAVGAQAAGGGPVGLGGERRERDPAGDLGQQALAVADDGRRPLVEVGPALAEQGEGDGVERAGLDVVAHAACGAGGGAARRRPPG